MKSSTTNNKWNAPIICFFIFFLIMIVLFLQFCYLGLSKNIYGISIKEFASNRNTVTSILTAERGVIFDVEGNILAQNITSYTLIACLDNTKTINELSPQHVVDKDYTATKLATILGEENYEYILSRLNSNSKQVEFGKIGKNLTELTKLSIEKLDLPGISFSETVKRYYPNGNFASYIIGYAKQYTRINLKIGEKYDLYNNYKNLFNKYSNISVENNNENIVKVENNEVFSLSEGISVLSIKSNNIIIETIIVNVIDSDYLYTTDTTIVGELGIESNFEKKLQGTDGYLKYQQDKYGYKIPDTPEELVEAVNGYNIYLTLNSNIQRFAENAVNEIESNYNPEWSFVTVMNAETGSILASATNPSYNPNSLSSDMSYENPLVSYTYEPGSVMKIYTYMCAIETGKYDGSKSYLSGKYKFDDGTIMHDWDKKGWGFLTYDSGFTYSSNVAVINIIKDYLDITSLKKCLESYGFGKKTNIELSNEQKGKIDFSYKTELMAAGYGQGILTTPIQQLQALSIIANDGVMVKPHIIDKIVNTKTKKEIITSVEKSEKLVSDKTILKIKELMQNVISPTSITGKKYYLEGFNIIGKTGTAQIYENGNYLYGSNDYIVSVALMYPMDNPKIIIYAAAKKPSDASNVLPNTIKELVQNISKYEGINIKDSIETNELYSLQSYLNNDTLTTTKILESQKLDVIVIGDGTKIINQYPAKNTKVLVNDKVFLITNSNNITMPNILNWSKRDVSKLCDLIDIECSFEGYGFVTKQSIALNETITSELKLDVVLER